MLSETGPLYEFADEFGRDFNDRYSCDSVLDVDLDGPDGLINFLEEKLGTNPLDSDSDNDLLSDSDETKYGVVSWTRWCGKSSEVKGLSEQALRQWGVPSSSRTVRQRILATINAASEKAGEQAYLTARLLQCRPAFN